jgi:hypothetical protein
MTRINQTLALVTFVTMLASTGCGDPGSFEEPSNEDSSRVADDATSTLEDELQLACDAYCEAAFLCRRDVFSGDCSEDCADSFGAEADDACIEAEIDLLNCYSPASCDASTEELRIECGHALLEFHSACNPRVLLRDDEGDAEIRVIEVREIGDELSEVDGDPEETEPSEESGDEEPGDSEDSDPVFELPELPEYQELPDLGPIVGFP